MRQVRELWRSRSVSSLDDVKNASTGRRRRTVTMYDLGEERPLLLPEFAPARRRDLVSLVACCLETVFSSPARKNDKLPSDPKLITCFHSVSVPSMSIQSYFRRLTEYIDCSGEVFILAMVHINRIHMTHPHIAIDSLTIHRLLLTALMVTAKFFDDHVYSNMQWSNVGGVSVRELNGLEREFLSLLEYNMFVRTEAYLQIYQELCNPVLHTKCGMACQAHVTHYPALKECIEKGMWKEGPSALWSPSSDEEEAADISGIGTRERLSSLVGVAKIVPSEELKKLAAMLSSEKEGDERKRNAASQQVSPQPMSILSPRTFIGKEAAAGPGTRSDSARHSPAREEKERTGHEKEQEGEKHKQERLPRLRCGETDAAVRLAGSGAPADPSRRATSPPGVHLPLIKKS